jgi:hypothetical protein
LTGFFIGFFCECLLFLRGHFFLTKKKMNDDDLLKMAGLSTTGVAILLIAWRVFKSIQGKKVVSTCCGHRGEVGVDVVNMSPLPNPRGVPELSLRQVPTATPYTTTSQ